MQGLNRGLLFFFFSSRRRHTILTCDWSSDVCSSDLPLTPLSKQKGIEFQVRAFKRAGCGRGERLLPMTSCFAVLENFVEPDDAVCIKMELLSVGFSPNHEGCVAVASPSDRDRAIRHLVVDDTMLGEFSTRIRFSDAAAGDSNYHIAIGQKRRLRCGNEFRMIDGRVRQHLRLFFLSKSGSRKSGADCEHGNSPNP